MNAVIYARFSPRRNAEECESIETQLDLCRQYCARNELTIKAEYSDRALSGAEEDRPGLWAAIDALGRGDVLVVYRLDRLARTVYLSHIIERAVTKRRGRILSTSGEGTWQDTDEDELIRNILHALAQYERKVIIARTRSSMLRYQANGRRMSAKTPYGWMPDPDDHALLVESPEEQDIIRRVVFLHSKGFGYREIARALEEDCVPCRGRDKWHHSLIQSILKRRGVQPAKNRLRSLFLPNDE